MNSIIVTSLLVLAGMHMTTATEYVAEVYFVVEPEVVRSYQRFGYTEQIAIDTITSDIDYFIYQVNEMFQSMTSYDLDIQVRAKQVDMMPMTEEMFDSCMIVNTDELQADMAMAVFKQWLSSTGARENIGYDMAIVWTGYDLFSTAGNTLVSGYASVAAACTDSGVAVVEFDGTMDTATVTAHEIAHSLGAPHLPGDPNSACSFENGYIMNPSNSPTNENRWSFSICSAQEMINYISSLSDNCLVDTSTPVPSFQLSDAANCDLMDADKICQRKLKTTNGYFCHYLDFFDPPKGDDVCQSLKCGIKQTFTCSSASPTDGMICDTNKRCHKGSCVTSSIPTGDTDTDCVFGDIESEYIQGMSGQTCSDYVGADSYKCYVGWVNSDRCCATCKTRETGIEGCMYGDHTLSCKDYEPWQICDAYADVCCEFCHGWVSKRSVRPQRSHGVGVNIVDMVKDVENHPPPHPHLDDSKLNQTGSVTMS